MVTPCTPLRSPSSLRLNVPRIVQAVQGPCPSRHLTIRLSDPTDHAGLDQSAQTQGGVDYSGAIPRAIGTSTCTTAPTGDVTAFTIRSFACSGSGVR